MTALSRTLSIISFTSIMILTYQVGSLHAQNACPVVLSEQLPSHIPPQLKAFMANPKGNLPPHVETFAQDKLIQKQTGLTLKQHRTSTSIPALSSWRWESR